MGYMLQKKQFKRSQGQRFLENVFDFDEPDTPYTSTVRTYSSQRNELKKARKQDNQSRIAKGEKPKPVYTLKKNRM